MENERIAELINGLTRYDEWSDYGGGGVRPAEGGDYINIDELAAALGLTVSYKSPHRVEAKKGLGF